MSKIGKEKVSILEEYHEMSYLLDDDDMVDFVDNVYETRKTSKPSFGFSKKVSFFDKFKMRANFSKVEGSLC